MRQDGYKLYPLSRRIDIIDSGQEGIKKPHPPERKGAVDKMFYLAAKSPLPGLTKREFSCLFLISRSMAATTVAEGVLPPSLLNPRSLIRSMI